MSICIFVSAITLLGQLGQPTKQFVGTNGVAETPYGTVRVVGVGQLSNGKIECWNIDGKMDPVITERVQNQLHGQNIQFKYGYNNLFVLRETDSSSSSNYSWDSSSGDKSGWSWSQSIDSRYENQRRKSTEIALYIPSIGDKSITASGYFTTSGASAAIAPKIGAEFKLGTSTFKLIDVKKLSSQNFSGFGNMPSWQMVFKVQKGDEPYTSINAIMSTSTGQPYEYVDKDGTPKTRSEQGRMGNPMGFGVYCSVNFTDNDTMVVSSSANLAKAERITFTISNRISVVIPNVPISPNL